MSEINEILDIFFSHPLGKFVIISIAIIFFLNAFSIIGCYLPFSFMKDYKEKSKGGKD